MIDIAQICRQNNMAPDEFLSEISLNFLALMDMQLDKNENNPLTITRENVSLLIFRPERITHEKDNI